MSYQDKINDKINRALDNNFKLEGESLVIFARRLFEISQDIEQDFDSALMAAKTLTECLNSLNKENLSTRYIVEKLLIIDANFAISARDLAEALSRVGYAAQDAGVSFDELIGLVTAAQQTTGLGGAVIGNALKTIFVRISRPLTRFRLISCGVPIYSLSDLSGAELLLRIADAYDNASEIQRRDLVEILGGSYQINVIGAILKSI